MKFSTMSVTVLSVLGALSFGCFGEPENATATENTSSAISNGIDDNVHKNVGAMVVRIDGHLYQSCTGTLIAPTIVVTAAHCLDGALDFAPASAYGFTFDSQISQTSTVIGVTMEPNPAFDSAAFKNYQNTNTDLHDVAVLRLAHPVDLPVAVLPTKGLLEQLSASGAIKTQSTTMLAVGYGVGSPHKTPAGYMYEDLNKRQAANESLLMMGSYQLKMSMPTRNGSGGVCYGDSGGPQFLTVNGREILVSTTSTGTDLCNAFVNNCRLDTASARAFLSKFVTLP